MSLRLFSLVLLTGSLLLQADVIYSNFGVDGGYATGTGLIATNDSLAGASVAIGFTTADNYNLTSIEFVASSFIPGGVGASLGIFADDSGQPGGAALESFSLDGLLGQFGGRTSVLTLTSSLQPFLQANTQYWVGLQAPVGGLAIWNLNSTSAAGIVSSDGAGHWLASDAPQGALQVEGTIGVAPPPVVPVEPIIPEPVILDPIIPDPIVEAIIQAPRSSQAAQEAPILTPEPQTWWLMAVGLFTVYKQRSRLTNQK